MKNALLVLFVLSSIESGCGERPRHEVLIAPTRDAGGGAAQGSLDAMPCDRWLERNRLTASECRRLKRLRDQDRILDATHLDGAFFDAYRERNRKAVDLCLRRAGLSIPAFHALADKVRITLEGEPDLRRALREAATRGAVPDPDPLGPPGAMADRARLETRIACIRENLRLLERFGLVPWGTARR